MHDQYSASSIDYGNTQDHLVPDIDDLGQGSMVVGGLDVTVDLSALGARIEQAWKQEEYIVEVETTH